MVIQPRVSTPGKTRKTEISLAGEEKGGVNCLCFFVGEVKSSRHLRLHDCGEDFEFCGMVV
jgi:hypothetical protein